MKKNRSNKKRQMKNILLRSFLAISIICCVFLVSNCDQLINIFGPGSGNGGGTTNPPEFGASESSSIATELFTDAAKDAAGSVEGAAVSWAMSALGLSDGSPDYTAQLNKIDNDLQTIIYQLNGIQSELVNINNSVQALNCSGWEELFSADVKFVGSYWNDYQDDITTATDSTGSVVPNSVISDWVDGLLGQGKYAGEANNITFILNDFEQNLVLPNNTGGLTTCLESIKPIKYPQEYTFGSDTAYYNIVDNYRDFYFIWEVKALYLYSEAEHYMAWVAAGKPTSNSLSADSVSYVCKDSSATLFCNHVITNTNLLYNALISQFNAAGAPYTDENFIAEYRYDYAGTLLWPKSLESFTTAAGSSCNDPLTSLDPCGITAGFYDQQNMGGVTYKGYTGWLEAGPNNLNQLLAGWKSGTAYNYLQDEFGFQNMRNKVIISGGSESISLNESGGTQEVVPFIDTEFPYNWFSNVPGEPVYNVFQFQAGVLTKSRQQGSDCGVLGSYYTITYQKNPNMKNYSWDGFYEAYGTAHLCNQGVGDADRPLSFTTLPGWLASQNGTVNHEASARQFRWPVLPVTKIPCTENRSNVDINGIWTMCGDDFTAYIDSYVPRPETCDLSGGSSRCVLTSETVTNAKRVFGNNTKSNGSF